MTTSEVARLTRGDRLICIPSGLVVKAWEIHPEGVEVQAARGGRFTFDIDHLEVYADE